MNRRSFIGSLAGLLAWRPWRTPAPGRTVYPVPCVEHLATPPPPGSCREFTDYLLKQAPLYDREILRDADWSGLHKLLRDEGSG